MEVCNGNKEVVKFNPKGGEVYEYHATGPSYRNTFWLVIVVLNGLRMVNLQDGSFWSTTTTCSECNEHKFIKVNACLTIK